MQYGLQYILLFYLFSGIKVKISHMKSHLAKNKRENQEIKPWDTNNKTSKLCYILYCVIYNILYTDYFFRACVLAIYQEHLSTHSQLQVYNGPSAALYNVQPSFVFYNNMITTNIFLWKLIKPHTFTSAEWNFVLCY